MKSNYKVMFFIPLLFIGCTPKIKEVEVVKYKIIKPHYPKLKEYEFNKSLTLHLYNKKGFVCFKDESGCIKKTKLKEIVNYIFELKKINAKLIQEVKEYNQFVKGRNGAYSK